MHRTYVGRDIIYECWGSGSTGIVFHVRFSQPVDSQCCNHWYAYMLW